MLHCIKRTATRLWSDQSGASLLEYSILVGLITAGVIGSVMAVATWTNTRWTNLNTVLQGTKAGGG
jgi:pilus assembly protein Flp/PilA